VLLFGGIVFTILMSVVGDDLRRASSSLGHLMNSFAGLGAAALLAGVGMIVYSGLLPSVEVTRQRSRRAISPQGGAIAYPDGRLNTASMKHELGSAPSVTPSILRNSLYPQKSDLPPA
jgi:hypothetical protein